MNDAPGDITMLLRASALGDPRDADKLMAVIYDDLKRVAAGQLSRERDGHTLAPTALVHEAFLGRPVDGVGAEVVAQVHDARLRRRRVLARGHRAEPERCSEPAHLSPPRG